jgi:hypothetical protein
MIVVAAHGNEEAQMGKLQLRFGMVAVLALLCSGVVAVAQDKKPLKKGPACNAIKTQATCEGREDCQWVAALMDAAAKTQKRPAYCRAKPKAPDKQ